MIGSLKQSLEQLLGQNLSPETFIDTFMVAKTFECQQLLQLVIKYAVDHFQELRQNAILSKLD